MKRTIKRALSAVLTLCVLLSVAALSAAAAGPANPSGAYWDGYTARWSAPNTSSTVYGYDVTLFRNGSVGGYYYTTDTSYDFSVNINSLGNGNYSFNVRADYGSEYSDTINSQGISVTNSFCTHNNAKLIGFSYPTCTSKGVKEHYECPDCGKWFWDPTFDYEITDKSEVELEAYGHNWGEWVTVKAPTATADGEAKRVCAENPDHVEYKVLPKLGTESTATTAPAATAPATTAPATTAPATTAPATTAPATAAPATTEPESTVPASTENASGTASSAPTTQPDSGASGDSGMTGWLIAIIVIIVLAAGGAVALIILTSRKNGKK